MLERIKKTLMGFAALAALALGGGALVQAGDSGGSEKAGSEKLSEADERENSGADSDNVQYEGKGDEKGENGEKGEDGEKGEGGEKGESVSGPAAGKAKAAALRITKGGTANSVERDDENGATWEVEVTKRNGKTVDVRLDQSYKLVVVEGDGEGKD